MAKTLLTVSSVNDKNLQKPMEASRNRPRRLPAGINCNFVYLLGNLQRFPDNPSLTDDMVLTNLKDYSIKAIDSAYSLVGIQMRCKSLQLILMVRIFWAWKNFNFCHTIVVEVSKHLPKVQLPLLQT